MSEPHPSPFPTALVFDTSFLRTIGGTGTDSYQTFIQYVRAEDRELYLSSGVVEELTEQRGYISVDWVDRADTTEWITLVGDVQPGVRVHNGPRAGEVMDRVHERLAAFEQIGPRRITKDRLGTAGDRRDAPRLDVARLRRNPHRRPER